MAEKASEEMSGTALAVMMLMLLVLIGTMRACAEGIQLLAGESEQFPTEQEMAEWDVDHDGYSPAQGDYNDFNPEVNPGATELYRELAFVELMQYCDWEIDPYDCMAPP